MLVLVGTELSVTSLLIPPRAMAVHLGPLAAMVAILLLAPRTAAYPWPVCGGTKSFTANSAYQANLNLMAARLPKNVSSSPSLFATAAVGAARARVWAVGLCRGDANATVCFNCLTQAFQDLQNDCSYDQDGAIYYDPCVLHYSGVPVLSGADTGAAASWYTISNLVNVTSDPVQFNRLVAALINATADYAALNSTRRFAAGEADFDQEYPKVYGVAQCTPGQTPAQCRACLAGIIKGGLPVFENSIGGRVLWVNCSYRYETAPFFNGPAMVRLASPIPAAPAPAPAPAVQPPAAMPPPPPADGGGGTKYSVAFLVLVVALPILAGLNLVVCLCLRRRRRQIVQAKQPYPMYSTEAEDMEMVDSMLMDISTLRAATGDFDESNKLGEGGFGAVYKGVLPDGDEIAVKRLSKGSAQGVEELKNELALVAKLKHKNLVRLVGVCLEQQEQLLVYEFVPNRSLDLFLFGTENNERRARLDWAQRYKIINGVARGLQYLHEDSQLKVVHRDLKASNILLDENMNPKISDFGLARIFVRDQTQAVTSQIVGTVGYMAPEYLARGNYSVKSDAYSFGVMVLEIVTGRKNNDCSNIQQSRDLLTTAWEHWEAGTAAELVDPGMDGSFPVGDVLRCVHVALLCVQGDPAARPVMSSVVMTLGSDTVTLQAPSKPSFLAGNGGAAPNPGASTASAEGWAKGVDDSSR